MAAMKRSAERICSQATQKSIKRRRISTASEPTPLVALGLPSKVDAQGWTHRQLVLHPRDSGPTQAAAQAAAEVAGKGAKRSRRT